MGDDVWNTLKFVFVRGGQLNVNKYYLLGNTDLGDLAQLVACLLGGDAMDGESALDIIDKAESLV